MDNSSTFPPTRLASAARRALLLLGMLLMASAPTGCSEAPRQRKNVKELTARERRDYVDAVLKLKSTPSPYDIHLSWYDQFVEFHRQVYYFRPRGQEYQIGHESPTFLPWHRKFLLMYEQALREVSGKDITLPYWDWTDEASTQAVFSEDFMGLGGVEEQDYAVLRGPFRMDTWTLHVLPKDGTTTYLVRATLEDRSQLPTDEDISACLALHTYDAPPWDKTAGTDVGTDAGTDAGTYSFRNCLEGWSHAGTSHAHSSDAHLSEDCAPDASVPDASVPEPRMHNGAHVWVGGMLSKDGKTIVGSMAAFDTSPNDPAFFLHHANVDRIWAQWQRSHGISYVPGDGREGWNPPDSLYPFDKHPDDPRVRKYGNTVGDMLDVRELGYEYQEP
ncbi:tyrosinase family protein [Cystobacter fuscus]|uniref:tyrosinase family protein n=1 Tax=Cystobacter fuscus TaxID=43 RepID=UPI002B315D92|nr:tyrosinase family protein [Cystobacter fuscus]